MSESHGKLTKELEHTAGTEPRRWLTVFHCGFGYTVCPYCGDETVWYNPMNHRFQSDLKNNRRKYCTKCGERVYASEQWSMNQPKQ